MTEMTPGPWLISGQTVYALDETGGVNRFSCQMQAGYTYHGRTHKDRTLEAEIQANVTLVAAAPTMLADLIEAERMFRWYGDMHAEKPDLEKASRNYAMAARLAATIALATPETEA